MATEPAIPGSSVESIPRQPAVLRSRKRKGVLDPRRVRIVSFSVISLGLFGAALLCVLAIWDYAKHDTAWKSIATLGVITTTMVAFTILNEAFGARLDE